MEAVIDKDRASALLAIELAVDLFAISTDTDYVYLNYKKPDQMPLTAVTVLQARAVPYAPDIFRQATWGRRSSRSFTSCAAAAKKR